MTEKPIRFVVQRHDREEDPHFDIMLEREGTLRTWSCPAPPGEDGPREVRSIQDHRITYLSYEGEISGGRGSVRIWDRGTYRSSAWDTEEVVALLHGERLRGQMVLQRIEGDRWSLTWTKSEQ
ncbi:MAG: hypothetical protein O7H41_13225 [Planctomycetota bacterium]|nr:hypothetical protein [Planctomycetota bacterium]